MKRTSLNFLVDAITLAALFGMIGTGLLIRFVLLPGSGGHGGGAGLALWGRSRHDWGDIHYYFAIVLLGVIVIHIAMHWSWIWGMVSRWVTRHHPGHTPAGTVTRNLAGVVVLGLFVMISATFVWLAASSIQVMPAQAEGRGGHGYRGGRAAVMDAPSPPAVESDQSR